MIIEQKLNKYTNNTFSANDKFSINTNHKVPTIQNENLNMILFYLKIFLI